MHTCVYASHGEANHIDSDDLKIYSTCQHKNAMIALLGDVRANIHTHMYACIYIDTHMDTNIYRYREEFLQMNGTARA